MQGRIQKAGSSSGLDVKGMVTTGTDNIRVHGHISIVLIVCSKHCDRKEVQVLLLSSISFLYCGHSISFLYHGHSISFLYRGHSPT
jgi:hypothetical protein